MIIKELFGKSKNGIDIYLYTIKSKYGLVKISSLGASIESIIIPDKNGNYIDVALGFDNVKAREKQNQFIGSIIGRCANRIGNGRFKLNGKVYDLYVNDPPNHLHGGNTGFYKRIWQGEIKGDILYFYYKSNDGEEGYPGNLYVTVSYEFDNEGLLTIKYYAVSDADTVVNLTNHTYFNLSGHDDGNILDHLLYIKSYYFTECDENCLPNDNILPVIGTPMDFRNIHKIGDDIDSDYIQIKNAGGYDHNYIIHKEPNEFGMAAEVISLKTGIKMTVFTDMPGIQFYTGNNIKDLPIGKENCIYKKRSGFCLETQFYPDAINKKDFPSPILKANEEYIHKTCYKFDNT